jgi:hypothetical protein
MQVLTNDPKLLLPQHRALRELLSQQGKQSHWGKIS